MSMPSAVRLRWSNRVKCLMCYLVCFALPLLWQAAASLWIYPLKLTGTAPNVALHLQAALPFSPAPLEALARSGEAAAATPEALRAALFSREQSWLWFLAACALAAWLITLAVQLLWRAGRGKSVRARGVDDGFQHLAARSAHGDHIPAHAQASFPDYSRLKKAWRPLMAGGAARRDTAAAASTLSA